MQSYLFVEEHDDPIGHFPLPWLFQGVQYTVYTLPSHLGSEASRGCRRSSRDCQYAKAAEVSKRPSCSVHTVLFCMWLYSRLFNSPCITYILYILCIYIIYVWVPDHSQNISQEFQSPTPLRLERPEKACEPGEGLWDFEDAEEFSDDEQDASLPHKPCGSTELLAVVKTNIYWFVSTRLLVSIFSFWERNKYNKERASRHSWEPCVQLSRLSQPTREWTSARWVLALLLTSFFCRSDAFA